MQQRKYHYIKGDINSIGSDFEYKTIEIESEDTFEGPLDIFAFHISLLPRAHELLSQFGYNNDRAFFDFQCREVISAPEQHVNNKGEGLITFRVYFKNVPQSITSINENATVVIVIAPKPALGNQPIDYDLVGYIHANEFFFNSPKYTELKKAYFYNLLRINELADNQDNPLFRKKRVFTLLFSVLRSLVDENEIHYVFATMGKENQTILEALANNSKRHNKFYKSVPFTVFTRLNHFYSSGSAFKKLTVITHDKARLAEMHAMVKADKHHHLFYNLHTVADLEHLISNIKNYSKSSDVYALIENDKIKAAAFVMNWGDYFDFTLKNPKGVFKLISALKLTNNLMYPFLITGDVKSADTLLKGVTYKFRTQDNCYISLINSEPGDKYESAKKSFLKDDYNFFLIYDRMEDYNNFESEATDSKGNLHLFYDNPLL
jgi:hypothetical protein